MFTKPDSEVNSQACKWQFQSPFQSLASCVLTISALSGNGSTPLAVCHCCNTLPFLESNCEPTCMHVWHTRTRAWQNFCLLRRQTPQPEPAWRRKGGVSNNWQSGCPASRRGRSAYEWRFCQGWQWRHLRGPQLTPSKIRPHDPVHLVYNKKLSSLLFFRIHYYLQTFWKKIDRFVHRTQYYGGNHTPEATGRGAVTETTQDNWVGGSKRERGGSHLGSKWPANQCT